jgi:hypothetical protein
MGVNLTDLNNNKIYLEVTDTLARRIDFAWSIYSDKTHDDKDEKQKALFFLMYAFDISDVATANTQLIDLMKERNLYKTKNPEYIPGKQLTRLPFDPRGLILKAIAPLDVIQTRVPTRLTKAFKSAELLDVNIDSKFEDANSEVTFLSEEERASYRVNIHQGKFQKDGENFDTSEMGSHLKLGFAAFTLNANGELSVFTHQGYKMLHSSMNAGAPVVAAGELEIKDGILISITTHSGHYMPSIFNIYRALEYFSLHDVDIKQTQVITFENPSSSLQGVVSKEVSPIPGSTMYQTSATQVYRAMNKIIEKNIHNIHADLTAYQSDTSYNTLLKLKDKKMEGNLTQKRSDLARSFVQAIQNFKATLPEGLSRPELKDKLRGLDSIISTFQEQNEALSSTHNKKKSSGRLAKKMQDFRTQLQTLKPGEDDSIETDIADNMKKLR